MDLANNILDAIDILADNSVSAVKFDKTVRASIYEVVDESIGKYKVKYQNSIFYAYSLDIKRKYAKGTNVFIVIPASDFNKDPYITGTTKKLALSQNEVLTWEDRLSPIGTNVVESEIDKIGFCSYESNDRETNTIELYNALATETENKIHVDSNSANIYKVDSEYILVGATVQTALDEKQRSGGGDYGVKITCRYWNPKYKDYEAAMASDNKWVYKDYILCVDNMSGQPYSYTAPSNQYAIYPIDTEHFDSIYSIKVFCKEFPARKPKIHGELREDGNFYDENGNLIHPEFFEEVTYLYDKNTQVWYSWNGSAYINQSDIFISNIKCEFYDALSEEELQGLSLRITTPYGGFFYMNPNTGRINPEKRNAETEELEPCMTLHAEVRIQGKKVNYQQQKVNFYWFVKDNRVTSNSAFYNPLAGAGWRCLNSSYRIPGGGVGFNAETADKDIKLDICKAYETNFKCIAVFMLDNITESVSGTKIIYNKAQVTNTDVYILSSMGNSFKFDLGKTTLTCYINNSPKPPEGKTYEYWWSYSIDGGIEEIDNTGTIVDEETGETIPDPDAPLGEFNEHHSSTREVEMAGIPNFITYNCTIYDKTDGKDEYIGSASITLTNGQEAGQFTLVLHNGTRVFKYNGDGVSPASPSLDEFNRIAISALEFDIYNEQGQLIGMSNEEKPRICTSIMWFWPGSEEPSIDSTESMIYPLLESESMKPKLVPQLDPNTNNIKEKYATVNQAILPYGIANMYDIDKIENTISLQVVYKGQTLRASTNFTFTKDGEQGSNGTQFITRIVPIGCKRIVIKDKKLQKELNNGSYEEVTGAPFMIEVWDGGTVPYIRYEPNKPISSQPYNNQVIWSTALKDRNLPSALYVDTGNEHKGIFKIDKNSINNPQNITIKACLTTDTLSENQTTYFDTYPVDVIINDGDYNYEISGGYREVSYKSDGTRNDYCKKPFQLLRNGVPLEENITWRTGWGTIITEAQPQILPPINYISENIDTWIAAYEGNVLRAYVPIDLHLDRYGLSAMNDWDGSSLKLNQNGSNYILAPQIGAGHKVTSTEATAPDKIGTFTGVTMGEAFTNGTSTGIGLFGYHEGERSIFLDAKTGNATFGKSGKSQIKIDATSEEGTITSGDYAAGKGMKIKFSNTGEKDSEEEGPYIKFGSGHFKVDSKGNITAVDGGTIANWEIGKDILQSGDIWLKSGQSGKPNIVFNTPGFKVYGTGSFSAANGSFEVTKEGVITASAGTIGGWHISGSRLYAVNSDNKQIGVTLNSSGYIGGAFVDINDDSKGRKWEINANGIATFRDVRINNTQTSDKTSTTTILNINNGQTGDNRKSVTIDSGGKITANDIDASGGTIAGWNISPTSISKGSFALNSNGTIKLGNGFQVNSSSVTKSDGNHSGSHSGTHSGTGGVSGSPFSHNVGPIYGENKDWAAETTLMTNIDLELHSSVVRNVTLNGNPQDGYTLNVDYIPGGIIGINNWKYRKCDWLGDRGNEQSG